MSKHEQPPKHQESSETSDTPIYDAIQEEMLAKETPQHYSTAGKHSADRMYFGDDTPGNKHELKEDGSNAQYSVASIIDRIKNEDEGLSRSLEGYGFSKREEEEKVQAILGNTELSPEDRENMLKSVENDKIEAWRQSVLDKRETGIASPEEVEEELRAGPPWQQQNTPAPAEAQPIDQEDKADEPETPEAHETSNDKEAEREFFEALDKELALLVKDGKITIEEAGAKRIHARHIRNLGSLFSDDPSADAHKFALEGIDSKQENLDSTLGELDDAVNNHENETSSEVESALSDLDDAVNGPEKHETNDDVLAAIDDLDTAVNHPEKSNDIDDTVNDLDAAVNNPIEKSVDKLVDSGKANPEKKRGLLSKIRELASFSKFRREGRVKAKETIREKLALRKETKKDAKEARDMDSFLDNPTQFGFALREWVRRHKEKRYKKLSRSASRLMEDK